MTQPDMQGALAGTRVIEIADEKIAYAGKMFADMGADVILIEPPGGSRQRTYEPFVGDTPHPEKSLYFWHYNTSKRGITLDLDLRESREAFKQLIASADYLLESERPGRLKSLGLGYDDLKAINERLIMVSMTPFGQDDPRSAEPVTDLTVLANGGPVWNCGYDDHSLPPVRGGGNQGYHTGCHFAVMSALTADLYRDVAGIGQFIDVNMHACANVTTEAGSYTWLVAQDTVQRQTGRHAGVMPSAPAQIECSDGRWVNSGIPPRRPAEFGRLYDWMAEEGVIDDFLPAPLLQVGMERETIDLSKLAEDEEIAAIFGAAREAVNFLASRIPAYDFFSGAQQRGFQVGIIYSPEEVLNDPHFVERGFPVEVEHPELGAVTYPGAPYKFTRTPWAIRRPAPLLGEHNEEVFAEMGIGSERLAELRRVGAI